VRGWAFSILLLGAASSAAAQRTDVVVLVNGDAITGEIHSLDRGALTYKTDDAGTLTIKWERVVSLRSDSTFEVELSDGMRLYGTIEPGPDTLQLQAGGRSFSVLDAVRITPIESGFWARTTGYMDVGLTYAKANGASTSTFDSEARYRGRLYDVGGSGSFYRQHQDDSEQTLRTSLSADASRRLGRSWYATGFMQFSRNDELSLEFRTLVGSGGRYRFFRTNDHEAIGTASLVGTRENYEDEGSANWGLEFATHASVLSAAKLLLDKWYAVAKLAADDGVQLVYDASGDGGMRLLREVLDPELKELSKEQRAFRMPRSMRDVEAAVDLQIPGVS